VAPSSETSVPPPAAPVAGPGSEVGRLVARRYRLRGRLGGGGMSVVWSADDDVLRRRVAVKEVTGLDVTDDDTFARTLREARAAARVEHPGVIRIHDVVTDDRPWIVMELLPGSTLLDAVRRDGPVSPGRAVWLGLRLIEALQAVHQAGIVHGDVKPGNVHLCGRDRVVLADFGISHWAGETQPDSDMIIGSPAYMSPERIHSRESGPASDVFSLGATLYAAVEGRPPFDNSSPAASLAAVLHDPPRPFQESSGPLCDVISGMLAKDVDQRMRLDRARSELRILLRQQRQRSLAAGWG
jgi:eukaryotic-like serine/threonine-protein kinase